jgi:hypothetical protein
MRGHVLKQTGAHVLEKPAASTCMRSLSTLVRTCIVDTEVILHALTYALDAEFYVLNKKLFIFSFQHFCQIL